MARIRDLQPGDEVRAPISFGEDGERPHPIFLYKLPHPVNNYFRAGLYLVVWILPDDSISFDTISPEQDIGDVIPDMTPEKREQNLAIFWNTQKGIST